jgi:RNase P/RNase MRP subunit p30
VVTKAGFDSREVIEKSKTDVLFGLEEAGRKDFVFSRNSGLNHVLCRLAKEKSVMIGFAFSSILNSKNKQIIIGRMKQNIRLCSKYKADAVIASFAKDPFGMRSPHDLAAFFLCLGMGPEAVKRAFESVSLRVKKNAEKKSKGYLAEGVSVVEG